MWKRKPVFTNFNKIYYRVPRLRQPPSSAWLPALVTIAKSRRREVEAICRLMTQHTAGAQMLHYLLRWFKNKPSIRMTESDWIAALALSKKEIRYGKQALQAAGLNITVEAHQTGRATFFSIDYRHFLRRLKSALSLSVADILKLADLTPIRPTGTDPSNSIEQTHPPNGGQTVITESTQSLTHQSDDDDFSSLSDSGEFSFIEQKESRDTQRDQHDATRRYLEDKGVKAPAIAAAAKHPLPQIKRAFDLAQQHKAANPPAYALAILQHGDFSPPKNIYGEGGKSSISGRDGERFPSPSQWGGVRGGVKLLGVSSFTWSDYADNHTLTQHANCPDCLWPEKDCNCKEEKQAAHA